MLGKVVFGVGACGLDWVVKIARKENGEVGVFMQTAEQVCKNKSVFCKEIVVKGFGYLGCKNLK